jgi:uncharacterized protein YcfL
MRIVITKNGKLIIQEINPEVKYKSLITSHNPFRHKKIGNKLKLEKSRNSSLGKTPNNISTIQNNIDIDDVLLYVQTKNKKLSSSSQCKIINLDPNKRFTLPQSIADRYFTEQIPLENGNKNLLPDIFVTINKSIEKEANEKGYDYIYNNIASLQTMQSKDKDDDFNKRKTYEDKLIYPTNVNTEAGRYTTNFNLPKLLPSYPLKYILNSSSLNNIKKEVKLKEYLLKKGKKLTEDNFRSVVVPDPKLTLESSLKNEIKTENTNLITYLNNSNDIKCPFVERLSKYDDQHIKKLNKISQKNIFLKGQEKVIKEMIQNKLKGQLRRSGEEYKEELEDMKEKLSQYEEIVKSDEKKKIDKRERYLSQYREAEKYWVKSNALRFYKKSDPPKNSATALVV